jgi:hypothetical protein
MIWSMYNIQNDFKKRVKLIISGSFSNITYFSIIFNTPHNYKYRGEWTRIHALPCLTFSLWNNLLVLDSSVDRRTDRIKRNLGNLIIFAPEQRFLFILAWFSVRFPLFSYDLKTIFAIYCILTKVTNSYTIKRNLGNQSVGD